VRPLRRQGELETKGLLGAPYFLKVYGLTSRSSCPTTRPQLPILIITRPVRVRPGGPNRVLRKPT